jgi:integrase
MTEQKKKRGRTRGKGSLIKQPNGRWQFWYFDVVRGKKRVVVLRNSDGEFCETKEEADKAAEEILENLQSDKIQLGNYQRKKELAANALGDAVKNERAYIEEHTPAPKEKKLNEEEIWEAFWNNPNRGRVVESTTRARRSRLAHFMKWLKTHGVEYPSQLTAHVAEDYMGEVLESGISPKSYNDVLSRLKIVFDLSFARIGLTGNPFDGIKRKPQKNEIEHRKPFTHEQLVKIFRGFRDGFKYTLQIPQSSEGQRARAAYTQEGEFVPMNKDELEVLFMLGYHAGLDCEMGCLLKWENVDLKREKIIYLRHKTRNKRAVPIEIDIHPELLLFLRKAEGWRDDGGYILPNMADRYKRNPSGIQADARKIFRITLGVETSEEKGDRQRKLAISRYSFHSLRHTYATNAANMGMQTAVIAETIGHSTPQTTAIYTHYSDEARRRVVLAQPAIMDGLTVDMQAEEMRLKIANFVNSAGKADLATIIHAIEEIERTRRQLGK